MEAKIIKQINVILAFVPYNSQLILQNSMLEQKILKFYVLIVEEFQKNLLILFKICRIVETQEQLKINIWFFKVISNSIIKFDIKRKKIIFKLILNSDITAMDYQFDYFNLWNVYNSDKNIQLFISQIQFIDDMNNILILDPHILYINCVQIILIRNLIEIIRIQRQWDLKIFFNQLNLELFINMQKYIRIVNDKGDIIYQIDHLQNIGHDLRLCRQLENAKHIILMNKDKIILASDKG
ncbi:hypothetical protein pb186bvf_020937 [Paramecium bursaria]